MTSRSNEHGFTLFEMIVTLAVLGLALALVVGNAPHRGGRLDLEAAAGGVAQALRAARLRAIAEQRSVVVTAREMIPPAGTALTMAPPRIAFAPDGSASGGVLRVSARGGARVVTVDLLTGQVAVAVPP